MAGCTALSSGKEALVVSSAGMWGCKSNDVVWCVHRPHMGSLLILPMHFNWACKVLNGQKQSRSESMKSNAELWRLRSGQWDRGSNGRERERRGSCHVPTSWQGRSLDWTVAGEVITAYPITRGWKRCQPLSFPTWTIFCDLTPNALAYHDYWSWQNLKASPLIN